MGYLIFIIITLVLLVGFYALTRYERRRGTRLFADKRDRLDTGVAHIEFILTHVDFASFAHEQARHGTSRAGHAIAHFSLQTVRSIERFLTRLVKYLRIHHTVDMQPGENTREFVKTLSDFKDRLKDTRPEPSEIR